MAVTKRDFPKVLYVAIDEDGKDKYFIADSGVDTFEVARRLAKCEADLRIMRTWPEYKPDVEHAEEQEHEPERVEL